MPTDPRYTFNTVKPPKSPHVRHTAAPADNAFQGGPGVDTARYLIDPDDDFARPYLAIPPASGSGRGRAFIWPLGIEGFELAENAELGKHKYLGQIDIDVDITHRAETNITLSGVFPGWTSVENMLALRQIFYAGSPERGKILHLPGILPYLQYVACQDMRHSRAEDERTMDIAYSVSFVKIGTGDGGGTRSTAGTDQAGAGEAPTEPTGSTLRGQTWTGGGLDTLRKLAAHFYGDGSKWTVIYADSRNARWFNDRNIPSHEVPDYKIPDHTSFWV